MLRELLLGIVLRALSVGRGTLPSDGRGTERDASAELPVLSEGVSLELVLLGGRGTLRAVSLFALRDDEPLLKLDGGRGTSRPAGPGVPWFAEA